MLDKIETGRGHLGGSVEHSEGKGGESVVAILRFLCGSPCPCRLRTTSFWPRWQALSCVLTACRVLWGPISRVAFVTTMSNRTSLLCVVLLLLEGGWGVWCVGQVLPLQGVHWFKSPWHSQIWVTACPLLSSRSMFSVLLVVGGWAWIWLCCHYDYFYITLSLTLTWVNILLVYACSSL